MCATVYDNQKMTIKTTDCTLVRVKKKWKCPVYHYVLLQRSAPIKGESDRPADRPSDRQQSRQRYSMYFSHLEYHFLWIRMNEYTVPSKWKWKTPRGWEVMSIASHVRLCIIYFFKAKDKLIGIKWMLSSNVGKSVVECSGIYTWLLEHPRVRYQYYHCSLP